MCVCFCFESISKLIVRRWAIWDTAGNFPDWGPGDKRGVIFFGSGSVFKNMFMLSSDYVIVAVQLEVKSRNFACSVSWV